MASDTSYMSVSMNSKFTLKIDHKVNRQNLLVLSYKAVTYLQVTTIAMRWCLEELRRVTFDRVELSSSGSLAAATPNERLKTSTEDTMRATLL